MILQCISLNNISVLGDHNYKKNDDLPNTKQMITALPDVSVLDIKPENNNFLVLACDGIWNSLSSQEVVDFISERINKPDVKLSSICEEVCNFYILIFISSIKINSLFISYLIHVWPLIH